MSAEPQALTEIRQPPRAPWSFLLFRYSPWGPAITGILIGIALTAALILFEFVSGRPQLLMEGQEAIFVGCEYLVGDYRISIVGVILLAYTATARYLLMQWTQAIAGKLTQGDQFTDAETIAGLRWWGSLPGLIGAILCLSFAADIAERDIEWTREYWILPHIFNWFWCIPFGWVAGRFFYAVGTNAILFSRVAKSVELSDLHHTEPLEAAIRQGSISSFLSLIFLGLVSVHFVDPGLGLVAVGVLVMLFIIGVAISIVPVVGAVSRLQDMRDRQLVRLREEIAEEESQLLSHDPDYEPGRIVDIIALEKRTHDWRPTVFRFSNLARLILYSGIGFVSWLGAAAVSVVVEKMLGY